VVVFHSIGTKALLMVSAGASMVCVAIVSQLCESVILSSLLDSLCLILLVWCGLPRPPCLIATGVSQICRLVKSASLSLVSVYWGSGTLVSGSGRTG
jgi:hypothetical protein